MGCLEEVNKGLELKKKVKRELDRRYGLVETESWQCVRCCRVRLGQAGIRFRTLLGKGLLIGRTSVQINQSRLWW